MTNKEYFDRLVKLTPAELNLSSLVYDADDPGCWAALFHMWQKHRRKNNHLYYPLQYILYGKLNCPKDAAERSLYMAIADTMCECDEAFIIYAQQQGMRETVSRVCYDSNKYVAGKLTITMARFRHSCLLENLFCNRNMKQFYAVYRNKLKRIFLDLDYSYFIKYQACYKKCTAELFSGTSEWSYADWLDYRKLEECFIKGFGFCKREGLNQSIDAVYLHLFSRANYDCGVKFHENDLIQVKELPEKIIPYLFDSDINLIQYVKSRWGDSGISAEDYKTSYLFRKLVQMAEDKENPPDHETRKFVFNV